MGCLPDEEQPNTGVHYRRLSGSFCELSEYDFGNRDNRKKPVMMWLFDSNLEGCHAGGGRNPVQEPAALAPAAPLPDHWEPEDPNLGSLMVKPGFRRRKGERANRRHHPGGSVRLEQTSAVMHGPLPFRYTCQTGKSPPGCQPE